MAVRLILEIRWGKMAGTKALILAGHSLRVGRTELSDLAIPVDGQMSGEHFCIAWDGSRALLRDLGSAGGTKLGGQGLGAGEEAEVEHGGWIEAGETHFLVYVEGHTGTRIGEEDEAEQGARATEEEREARKEERARRKAAAEALESLRGEAEREPLYAILDTARDGRILELLREHVEAHRSLYDGVEGETLEDVAPYLVGPIREDSELLDKLVMEGWGKRWGIFCTSRERFVEIRRHWRRFLMVELEDGGERVYFRFYDPWVLGVFWGTCDEGQRGEMLEGIDALYFESGDKTVETVWANLRESGVAAGA